MLLLSAYGYVTSQLLLWSYEMQRFSVLFILVTLTTQTTLNAENWPGWRGPRGDGTSNEKNVPIKWNGEKDENIAWKVAIPGEGHASPVIWKNRVFVVSCDKESKERILVALDRRQGEVVWTKPVLESPLESKHSLNSFASGTPVTDGKHIYVTFLQVGGKLIQAPNVGNKRKITPGRMVVASFDFDGNRKWIVKPGEFVSAHGYCSSPVLHNNLLIVNGDHDGKSYIVALDKLTGKTVWKVPREHGIRSYVTPIIREINGRTQMVFSGSQHIVSLNPQDGSEHWKIQGPTEQFVASMVFDGNLFFMAAGFPTYHVMGIRPDGDGDVTGSHVEWHAKNAKCYVPSPVVVNGYLIVADDRGTANCFNAKTGKRLWQDRLGSHFSASLVTADGLVYAVADDGRTKVIRPGSELDVVADNRLGERSYASPAISDGQLFIRGEKHLFCIGTKRTAAK